VICNFPQGVAFLKLGVREKCNNVSFYQHVLGKVKRINEFSILARGYLKTQRILFYVLNRTMTATAVAAIYS
jgi:hypothetical protein